MAGYLYSPFYGVEPFENNTNAALTPVSSAPTSTFGGGAEDTQDNLLVTLWGNLSGGQYQPVAGDLLQPGSALTGNPPGFSGNYEASIGPVFNSRTSFRISMQDTGGDAPVVTLPLMGILNPPDELVGLYQDAVAASVVNGALNLNIAKSLLDPYVWEAEFSLAVLSAFTNIPGAFAAGSLGVLPLARTNGADGVFPLFFDPFITLFTNNDVAGMQELLAAVNAGNFFVPVFLMPVLDDSTDDWFVKVTWPHSIAR